MNISRKTTETKISELIKRGNLPYIYAYDQTLVDQKTAEHLLAVPKVLETLAGKDARVIEYGDGSLGIEIEGKEWAAELPHREYRPLKALPNEVWRYLNLALGREIDGVRLSDDSARNR